MVRREKGDGQCVWLFLEIRILAQINISGHVKNKKSRRPRRETTSKSFDVIASCNHIWQCLDHLSMYESVIVDHWELFRVFITAISQSQFQPFKLQPFLSAPCCQHRHREETFPKYRRRLNRTQCSFLPKIQDYLEIQDL